LIVAKNSYSYSRSNYAYDNYAYDYEKYNSYAEEKKKDKREKKQKHSINLKSRLKLMTIVLVMFCTGMLIVGRYALIMNLNNQCMALKNKIAANQKENENLKLELMNFYDIKQIEKDATTKLSMVRPTGANTVSISIQGQDKSNEPENMIAHVGVEGLINRIVSFIIDFKGA